jgi:hypothetical protein
MTPTDGSTDRDTSPVGDGGGDGGGGGGTVMLTVQILLEMEGSQPPAAGASVSLLALDREVLATGTTDGSGRVTLEAPSDTLTFLRVAPVDGYAGLVRGQPVRSTSEEADSATLSAISGLSAVVTQSGGSYDATKAWVYAGFNPKGDSTAGGEGVTLSAAHAPAFTLYSGGVIVGETLAPECGDGPPACAPPGTRGEVVGFPAVEGSSTQITAVSPAGSTCVVRHDPGSSPWPLFPNTVTGVSVDCT